MSPQHQESPFPRSFKGSVLQGGALLELPLEGRACGTHLLSSELPAVTAAHARLEGPPSLPGQLSLPPGLRQLATLWGHVSPSLGGGCPQQTKGWGDIPNPSLHLP